MAIRIPKPNAKPKTPMPPLTPEPVETPEVVTTTHVTRTLVTATPVQNSRRIMIVASVVMLLIIGATVAAIGLPAYEKYLLSKEASMTIERAPVPKPVAKPAVSVVAASQPTPQPTDNLNKQTIVITGEQLGNGVPAASHVASNRVATAVTPVNPPNTMATAQNIVPADTNPNASQAPISPNNGPSDNSSTVNNTRSGMSYEEFVKTSQQSVFVDR